MNSHQIPSEGETGWAMSQGLLIAVLNHLGGSIDLPAAALERDAMGDAAGRLYSVALTALDNGQGVRLSVEPTTADK